MARYQRCSTQAVAVWLMAAIVVVVPGCGERGPPLPPEPRGPFPPENVRVRQLGQSVQAGFVVPVARGEKEAQQPVRAELVRVSYPPGTEPPADADAFRRRGEVVATIEDDPLPTGEAATLFDATLRLMVDGGVGYTLRYGVRVRDRRGRPSPLVVATDLHVDAPVGPPQDLRGEPTADGIRLSWQPPPGDGPFRYNVYRPLGQVSALDDPLNSGPLEEAAYLDTTVTVGESYSYRVRVAFSAGRPYSESADSPGITLVAQDRFAPSAPEGLVAVQEGLAVRLFWNPNPERDIRGYRVYRMVEIEGVESSWNRVGKDPIERPLYLDTDVAIGQRLVYRVTALDRAVPPNESTPSVTQAVDLREEPGEVGAAGS